MFEGDCSHHLRNIWFGAVILRLSKFLDALFREDLEKIPSIYRVGAKTTITELLYAVEKEFALTANYVKGHVSMLKKWMFTYHPHVLLYPVAKALGGNCQDIRIEGAPAVYMNLRYYLTFLDWPLSITGDNLLQKSLFYTLQSVEMIGLLCVLYLSSTYQYAFQPVGLPVIPMTLLNMDLAYIIWQKWQICLRMPWKRLQVTDRKISFKIS